MARKWLVIVAFAVPLGACGSSGNGTQAPEAGTDTGTDGEIPDAVPSMDGADGMGPPGDASVHDAMGGADADADGAGACGWQDYSTGLSGTAVVDVLFDSRAMGVVYATGGQHVYQSTDSGKTWHTQGFAGATIGYLAAPSTSPKLLLASSSTGVLRSMDAGATWSVLSLNGEATSYVAVAPTQPLRVFTASDGAGVLKSDDGASTWTSVSQGYPVATTVVIDVAPDNPDEAVTGANLLNAQGGASANGVIMRTTNAGQSWSTPAQAFGNVWNVRRCATNPALIYAATATGVAVSSDRGATWTVPAPTTNAVVDVELDPSNCSDVYATINTVGPELSTDGAMTFGAALTQGLDLIPQGTYPGRMVVDPQNSGHVLIGSHGGIWSSANAGTQWSAVSGLMGLTIESLGVSQMSAGQVWLSSWGSGVWTKTSSQQPWSRIPDTNLATDYAFVTKPDPAMATRVLVGGWPTLFQSNDGMTFTANNTPRNAFDFAFDPTNSKVLYASTQLAGVYKSADSGNTWTQSNGSIAPWVGPLGINAIDVEHIVLDPASSKTVYIGTNGQGVYASTDGGGSWTNVLAANGGVVSCLAAVPGSSTTIYACIKGMGVFQSTNGGSSWSADINGLPSTDVGSMVVDPSDGSIYVSAATDVFLQKGATTWKPLDPACPPGTGYGALSVMSEGSTRWLVGAGSGGVSRHPL